MATQQQEARYKTAVQRNIQNFTGEQGNHLVKTFPQIYSELPLEQIKIKAGIRAHDSAYDSVLTEFLDRCKAAAKKSLTKAKKAKENDEQVQDNLVKQAPSDEGVMGELNVVVQAPPIVAPKMLEDIPVVSKFKKGKGKKARIFSV